jgi:hypothetical protein
MIDPYFAFLMDPTRDLSWLLLLVLVFALGYSSREPAPNPGTAAGECLQCLEPVATGHLGYCSPWCKDDHHGETAWFAAQAAEELWERSHGRRVSGCEVCDVRILVLVEQRDGKHNCGSANCRFR